MKNVNEYVTVTNDGRCIMTQLKSLSMKLLDTYLLRKLYKYFQDFFVDDDLQTFYRFAFMFL